MKTLTFTPGVSMALREATEVQLDRSDVSLPDERTLALHLIRVGAEAIVRDDMRDLPNLSTVRFIKLPENEDVNRALLRMGIGWVKEKYETEKEVAS